MSKFLYPIYKLNIESYKKWWLYHKKAGGSGILSEILQGFSFNLANTLNRKFKLFDVEGNSVQDGSPSPETQVPILSSGDDGSINEKIQHGNEFDKSKVLQNYELLSTDGLASAKPGWYVSDYIVVEENKPYYLGGNKTSGNANCFYDKDKKFISTIRAITNAEIIAPQGARYLRTNGLLSELDNNISIRLNEEQDYSIFVQQPFRSNKDKTIKDKFVIKSDNKKYERHYIGEVVLNGSEEIYLYNDNGNRAVFYINVSDLYDYTNSAETPELLSNRFRPVSQTATWEPGGIACRIGGRAIFFIFETGTTINDFKNWLSTHNVVVQYELAEPQDLPCTSEQVEQLENLPSTYKDFTIIQSEDTTPAHLKIQYWKEVQS